MPSVGELRRLDRYVIDAAAPAMKTSGTTHVNAACAGSGSSSVRAGEIVRRAFAVTTQVQSTTPSAPTAAASNAPIDNDASRSWPLRTRTACHAERIRAVAVPPTPMLRNGSMGKTAALPFVAVRGALSRRDS